jgi:hypothetical protein
MQYASTAWQSMTCDVWDIPWKTNTNESKILTSPSQTVMKFGIHFGLIVKHLCLTFFNFCQVIFEIQAVENHLHQGKIGMYMRLFFNNSFDNALRETF